MRICEIRGSKDLWFFTVLTICKEVGIYMYTQDDNRKGSVGVFNNRTTLVNILYP
jgi:hypothetical protein